MVDCDIFHIEATDSGWALRLNGQVIASGMDQDQAERAARAAARMSTRRGRRAEILVAEGNSRRKG